MRSVIEAWGRDDIAQFLAYCAEDIEWHPVFESRLSGQAAAYRGREGMRRAWNEYRQIWGEVKVRPDDIRDLGDRVLMLGHIHGRGKGSGMPFDAPVAMLFSLRDGQIARSEDFPNHEQGLRAAGLAE